MDQDWPAQNSEFWPIEKITPYARNSRTHSDEQVSQIAASIREWGWTNPILVDEDGGLIAGHGRLLAARKLGLTQIPTMVAKGWSEAQKKAYIIADNKLALNAGWDLELLAVELGDLQGFDFDLMLTGFSDDELGKLLAEKTEGNTDPDEIPEVPIDPIAKPGDVWLLGKHRLVCGDSTDADTVAKALNGVSPHLMVTDPPYGVEYVGGSARRPAKPGRTSGRQHCHRQPPGADPDALSRRDNPGHAGDHRRSHPADRVGTGRNRPPRRH